MNSINLIPDSLDKPKSDLLIDSRLVADSSLPIQEQIFAITSVSSMSELDNLISEGKIKIDQYTTSIINQSIEGFFNIADLKEYQSLNSSEFKHILLEYFKGYLNQLDYIDFINLLKKADINFLLTSTNQDFLILIKSSVENKITTLSISQIFEITNTLGFSIFNQSTQNSILTQICPFLNLEASDNINIDYFLSHLNANPSELSSLPDTVLEFLLGQLKHEDLNTLVNQALDSNPFLFNRLFLIVSNIKGVSEGMFSNYFKEETFSKVISFITFLTENNLENQFQFVISSFPDMSLKDKFKFKTIQKRKLSKQFQKDSVILFENIFYKKNISHENLTKQNFSQIVQIIKHVYTPEIRSEKFQSLKENLAQISLVNKIEFNETSVKVNIHSQEELDSLNSVFNKHDLVFKYHNSEFYTEIEGNLILIQIQDNLFLDKFNDSSKTEILEYLETFNFETFLQSKTLKSLDLYSVKMLKILDSCPAAIQALARFKDKEYLFEVGILMQLFQSNAQNTVFRNGEHLFLGNNLGKGSFGTVQNVLTKINGTYQVVAFKQPRSTDENTLSTFTTEMKGSKFQEESNIDGLIPIFKANEDPSQPYVIMETGKNAQTFRQHVLSPDTSASIALDDIQHFLTSLSKLWEHGRCHSDFKPQNALVFEDQFTGEKKANIIDLTLPKFEGFLVSFWQITPSYSFLPSQAIYYFLDKYNLLPQELKNKYNKKDLFSTSSQIYTDLWQYLNVLIKKKKINKKRVYIEFEKRIARANDLKAIFQTLRFTILKKNIQLPPDLQDLYNEFYLPIVKVNQLQNQDSPDEKEVLDALNSKIELFTSDDAFEKLNNLIIKISEFLATPQPQIQNSSDSLDVTLNKDSIEQAQDPEKEIATQNLSIPEIENQLPNEITINSETESTPQKEIHTQIIKPSTNGSLEEIISSYLSNPNPTQEEFNQFMVQINSIFENRNGQKQSFKRKLKNFVFGKVSLKTKLKAAAISIPAGAILSSKAILSATGLATLVGTSPVMPIVLMTIFFKTCSASSLSTIFTKLRLKKLLKDDNFDSRIVKLFYYAKQAVGNEDDIQKELDINLETLKDGGTLTAQQIQTSLEALSKNSNQDKIKDFLGGLGLSAAISSAIYYGLNYEPVANFIQDKIQTLKSWLPNIFESNSATPVSKPQSTPPVEASQTAQTTTNTQSKPSLTDNPQSSQPNQPLQTSPENSSNPNPNPTDQLPGVSRPVIENTQGYIQPTGNPSDTIQINSNGSRVHMRGPDGTNLTNRFGFNRYWNARNPIVRVDLSNPRIVEIDGKNHVIYQTLLKGKLSGRWISGTMIGGR